MWKFQAGLVGLLLLAASFSGWKAYAGPNEFLAAVQALRDMGYNPFGPVTERLDNVTRALDGLNQTISMNGDRFYDLLESSGVLGDLSKIGDFALSAQTWMQNPTNQVFVYVVGGAVATAAVFYVGRCTYTIGKTIYGWCKKDPRRDEYTPIQGDV